MWHVYGICPGEGGIVGHLGGAWERMQALFQNNELSEDIDEANKYLPDSWQMSTDLIASLKLWNDSDFRDIGAFACVQYSTSILKIKSIKSVIVMIVIYLDDASSNW